MKWTEFKAKAKAKFKKACDWIDENSSDIMAIGGSVLFGFGIPIGLAVLANKFDTTKPVDIVKYSNGWLLLDAYEPNVYWPTTHGLNMDELQQVADLVVNEQISTGDALIRLGLLRVNA